jgi:ankyrin repeat protein
MVETLIEAGAKVDPRDRKGRTPLSHAAEMHRPDVINLLLDHGADIDATHGQGVTPLMDALCEFIRPDDPEQRERALLSVKILIDRGASIQATTEDAGSALHCAARFGDLPVVERMISLGANLNQTSASGAPISQAAWSSGMRAVEIAELLLQNGARLDIPDNLGFYPIHRAAQMGNIDMLKLLLKHGADPNVPSEIGKTPLQMAIEWDQKEAAAFLKEATRN